MATKRPVRLVELRRLAGAVVAGVGEQAALRALIRSFKPGETWFWKTASAGVRGVKVSRNHMSGSVEILARSWFRSRRLAVLSSQGNLSAPYLVCVMRINLTGEASRG